jgi:hypothetical protein
MAEFRHYIMTRFNVGLPARAAGLGLSPEQWMDHRLRLFTTMTLPSIRGQTCQNFTWLVLMDRRTPERYIRTLNDVQYRNMRLVYPQPKQHRWLPHLDPGPYDLITTRIDNDDAFHRETVYAIQSAWRARREQCGKPWVIVFPFGLIYDLTDHQGWLMEYWFNNCPSLVEDGEDPRTIWEWDHCQIPRRVGRHYIKDRPYWLQVIHAHNLRNAVHTNNPLRIVHDEAPAKLEHLRHFSVDPDALPALFS